VTAPDLGDDPNENCELCFFATRRIMPGEFFRWYYGQFHGIFKRKSKLGNANSSDKDPDSSSDDDVADDDIDSEDDVQMAMKLAAQAAADHKMALDMQKSFDEGNYDDLPKHQAPDAAVSSVMPSTPPRGGAAPAIKKIKLASTIQEPDAAVSSVMPATPPRGGAAPAIKNQRVSDQKSKKIKVASTISVVGIVAPSSKRNKTKKGTNWADLASLDAELELNSSSSPPPNCSTVAPVDASSSVSSSPKSEKAGQSFDSALSGVPQKTSLCDHSKCWIASTAPDGSSRFQPCFVEERIYSKDGLVTHYKVSSGSSSNPTRCVIDAVQAHKDLAAYSTAKQNRMQANLKLREDEKEQNRQESAKKYQSGELTFVPGPSPGHSPVRSPAHSPVQSPPVGHDNFHDDYDFTVHQGRQSDESDRSDEDLALGDGNSSDSDNVTLNESGLEAIEISKSKRTIELSTLSAEEIWTMFNDKSIKGGSMARTLFISGKALESKICEPWVGDKKLGSRIKEKADQRSSFLMWASSERVLQWIRLEIYKIILSKPQTYKTFTVTHAKAPLLFVSNDGKSALEASQASDHTMARVAHLACSADSRVVLNMLFGSKAIEQLDAPDLRPDALWQDLATVYVNNRGWDVHQIRVLQLDKVTNVGGSSVTSSSIDIQQVPIIGVTAECVRLVFNEVKKIWTDLGNAVFGRTGCNMPVGEDLYGKVWTNFIHGKMIFFARPEVAMYVFKLWAESDQAGMLPKYCKKELRPEAQVRMGVNFGSHQKFTLPVTPKGSSSQSQGFTSPQTPSTSSGDPMQTIASYLVTRMQREDEKMQRDEESSAVAKASSVAPKNPQVTF
jgi:hypothetical protein